MDDLSISTCMAIEALLKKQGYAFDTPNFNTNPNNVVIIDHVDYEPRPRLSTCSLNGNSYRKGEKIDIDY